MPMPHKVPETESKMANKMEVKVSAVLPLPAAIYFVERDTLAFRSLMAKASSLIVSFHFYPGLAVLFLLLGYANQ
jgi:hypothetical protein